VLRVVVLRCRVVCLQDYPRPFCTLSLMSTASILFDKFIKVPKPDVYVAAKKVPLPERSVLVLEGNGANVAQHCIPPVASERISITFRRMPEWAKEARAKHSIVDVSRQ
jgi:hypothetical protein